MIRLIAVGTLVLMTVVMAYGSDNGGWGKAPDACELGTYMDFGIGLRVNELDKVKADPLVSLGISQKFARNISWLADLDYRHHSTFGRQGEARTYGFSMGIVAEDDLGSLRPFLGAGISWKRYEVTRFGEGFEETKLGILLLAGFSLPVDRSSAIQFGIKHIHNAERSHFAIAAQDVTTPPEPDPRPGETIGYGGTSFLYNPTELFVKYRFKL